MSTPQNLGEYADALKADRYAKSAAAWTGPLIVFGWIVVVLAALVFVLGIVGSVIALVNNGGSSAMAGVAVGTTFGAVGASFVVLLQGAVVLAVAYYIRARSHWTRYQVGSALQAD